MNAFFSSLLAASRRALQWRLLLLWIVALLVPTLIFTVPFGIVLAQQLDWSAHADDIARALNGYDMVDLINIFGRASHALFGSAGEIADIDPRSVVVLAAAIATVVLLPWVSGATIAAARAPTPPGFAALARAGFTDYWRMLRLSIVAAILLGAAGWAISAIGDAADRMDEKVILESSADTIRYLQALISAVVFLIVQATVEAARAQLTLDSSQRSAWRAWWRALKAIRRRPASMMGAFLILSIAGAALVAALLLVRLNMTAVGPVGLIAAFVVAQAVVAVSAWMKTARIVVLADQTRLGRSR